MLLMLIGVACFGAVASLARFFVIEFFKTSVSDSFPWGTLAVNAIGCLAFGFLFTIFEERSHWDPQVRVVLLAGFAGAFTTYSTFAFESVAFLEQGKIGVALLNVAAQTIAGFSLIYLGLLFGRWVG